MDKIKFECDLHTHTSCSDGKDTPKEAIDKAVAAGLKVLAITDHDVVPPEFINDSGTLIPIKEYAIKRGLHLIPGIEISCDTENEDVHLVCLGCDWKHPYFAQMEQEIEKSKLESYEELIHNFHKIGYNFSWTDVLEKTGNKNRPNKIQKKQIFQYLADRGVTADWSVAKKLVQITPELNVKRKKPNPVDVIHAVHETGGIVIMAHPYLVAEPVSWNGEELTRQEYISILIDAGLDGIEVRYTYDKTSYRGNMTQDEIDVEVRKLYGSRLSILSGGSDYHGETQSQVAHPRMQGEEGVSYEYISNHPILKKML